MDTIRPGATNQSILFHLSTGGLPVTAYKLGYIRWVDGDGLSFTETIIPIVAELATINTGHTSNWAKYLSTDTTGGNYFVMRVDFPSQAFDVGVDKVICNIYDEANNVIGQRIFKFVIDLSGYYGAVWYDAGSSNSGAVLGIDGTAQNPVGESESAKALLAGLGTKLLNIEGILLLESNWHDLADFRGRGLHSEVDGNGQDGGDNRYASLIVTGIQVADDETIFNNCLIDGAINIAGASRGCVFDNINSIGDNTNGLLVQTGSPLNQSTTFNLTGTNRHLNLQGWTGDVVITNIDFANSDLNVIMAGGTLTLDASCTLGNANISGFGDFIDNSAGTVVDITGLGLQHWNGVAVTGDGDWAELQTDVDLLLTRLGIPYQLADGATLSDITAMLSEMAELSPNGGTYTRAEHSLQAIGESVNNIAIAGSAINKPADTDTLTTGSVISGTVADTKQLDGVYHQIEDTAGTLDVYYEFNIGGVGIPVNSTWIGRLNGSNDDLVVEAWDWDGAVWDQIGAIAGANGSTDESKQFTLFTDHVGSGGDLGKVRIRFQGTGLTSADLYTDQLFVSFAVINQSVGYANGAVWVDTVNGQSGTESFVNGTADNPCLTWADALTIAGNVGVKKFEIINGSTITLTASVDQFEIHGFVWTLDMNGQSMNGTVISGANAIGTSTNSTSPTRFLDCSLINATVGNITCVRVGFIGTITFTNPGNHYFLESVSGQGGANDLVIFDCGALVDAINLVFRTWSGGIQLNNFGQGTGTDKCSMDGWGKLILDATCNPVNLPELTIAGNIGPLTDNVAGGFVAGGGVLDDTARTTPQAIEDLLTSNHGSGSWQAGQGGGQEAFTANGEIVNGTTSTVGDYTDTKNIGVSDLTIIKNAGLLDYVLQFNVGSDHDGLSVSLDMGVDSGNNRNAEVAVWNYQTLAWQVFLNVGNTGGTKQNYVIGGESNDFIDTNGDVQLNFTGSTMNNNDEIIVDFASVRTQTSTGTAPSPEEIALAVDGQLSQTHGPDSWEGEWIKETNIESITVVDTVMVVAPKIGKDILSQDLVVARFRDSDGNDDFVGVVSYVEATGTLTILNNPSFSLTVGDRIDLAIILGEDLVNNVSAIKAKTDQMAFTVANQLDGNIKSIDDDGPSAVTLKQAIPATEYGTVGVGIHTTTLITSSNITGLTTDSLKFRVINFKTGINRGRSAPIAGYQTGTGEIQIDGLYPLVGAPQAGDTFTVT